MKLRLVSTTILGASISIAQQVDWIRQIQNKPYLDAREYNFTPKKGVNLTTGSNTVAFAPCPKGVSGNNTNHYLYVSGGTGAAESVLITGGTCQSGAQSGTLIFSAANNHTGSIIGSATGGLQEAICSIPSGQASNVWTGNAGNLALNSDVTDCGRSPYVMVGIGTTPSDATKIKVPYTRNHNGGVINSGTTSSATGSYGFPLVEMTTSGSNSGQLRLNSYFMGSGDKDWQNSSFYAWGDQSRTSWMPGNLNGWVGLCNTSGTTVTRISGSNFVPGMVNKIITIDGDDYKVTAVGGISSLTVDKSVGTKSNQNWMFSSYQAFSFEFPGRTVDPFASTMEIWSNGFWVGGRPGYDLSIVSQWDAQAGSIRALKLGIANQPNVIGGFQPKIHLHPNGSTCIGKECGTNPAGVVDIIGKGINDVVYIKDDPNGGFLSLGYNQTTHTATIDSFETGQGVRPIKSGARWLLGSGLTDNAAIKLQVEGLAYISESLNVGGCRIVTGSGVPNGTVTGYPCWIYLNTNGGAGTTLYIKETGANTNTGWVGK